jgi:hypothetical protein
MSGRRPRILLKARPTDVQLADRLRPPVPEGMELYLHEQDVSDADWFETLAARFARFPVAEGFTWVVEGPVWSLDGALFGICRNAEVDRELTRRLVRLAAHLGAAAVNVHCVDGTPDPKVLGEAARRAALDRAYPFLDWYAGLCRAHGLEPLIENVPPVCRMRRSAYIFTPIGVEPRDLEACARTIPGLGLTLDTSHAQLAVNAFRGADAPPPVRPAAAYYRDSARPQSLAAFIAPLLPWTRSAHISNAAGLLDEGLPYDEGDADLDAAVLQLAPHARYVVTEPIDPDDNHAVLKREMQARLARVLGAPLPTSPSAGPEPAAAGVALSEGPEARSAGATS